MMPLTLAAVGHVASLDIYSGHLVMIDSVNHASMIDNLPLTNNGDYYSTTWTRTYATKLYFPDSEYDDYIQPSRGPTHMFRVKNITGLSQINCFSSGLREFSIINDTGSIVTYDQGLIIDWYIPNAFGLVDLDISQNSIRTLIIRNTPCLKTLNVSNNKLTEIDLSTINSNWRVIGVPGNFLTILNVTSSQGAESNRENATLDCSGNQLTFLKLKDDNWSNIINLNCRSNSLTTLQVNTILSHLSTNGLNGGIVDLSNQTPAAPPTTGPPDGIGAVTTLTGNGWSVTTD